MPSRAKTAKGKAKRKGRGRKTTDWLAKTEEIDDLIDHQSGELTTTPSGSIRRQVLEVTSGQPSQTFTLTLGTETTEAIRRDAKKTDVGAALRALGGVTSVGTKGGKLLSKPVEIDFTKMAGPGNVPLMTTTPSTGISVTPGGSSDSTWEWDEDANWRDENSGRDIMEVSDMELTVDFTGLWRLTYQRKLYVFDHRWVYKLKAYSANNELLLRITVPASGGVYVLKPGSPAQPVLAEGASQTLADVLPEVDTWVRVGVGEYWD